MSFGFCQHPLDNTLYQKMIIMKKVKAILEEELLNGEVVKKGETIEVEKWLAEYLLRAYPNHWELVEGEEKEEVKEEKVEKKTSKKSK